MTAFKSTPSLCSLYAGYAALIMVMSIPVFLVTVVMVALAVPLFSALLLLSAAAGPLAGLPGCAYPLSEEESCRSTCVDDAVPASWEDLLVSVPEQNAAVTQRHDDLTGKHGPRQTLQDQSPNVQDDVVPDSWEDLLVSVPEQFAAVTQRHGGLVGERGTHQTLQEQSPSVQGRRARPAALAVPRSAFDEEVVPLPATSTSLHRARTASHPESSASLLQPVKAGYSNGDVATPDAPLATEASGCSATCTAADSDASSSGACSPMEAGPPSPLTPPSLSGRCPAATQPQQGTCISATTGEAADLQPRLDGSLLATCQKLGLLGEGAFGVVHRVLVTPPSGPAFEAARKQVPVDGPGACAAFAAEVAALKAGLGCPNIVQILDVRTTDGHYEILLELLLGGNLMEEVVKSRGGRLSQGRVRAIALGALRGLAHLHARHFCCRDVKALNIMLRSKGGEPVLVDMGLACSADKKGRLACQATHAGTLATMAPEMLGRLMPRGAGPAGKAGGRRKQKQVPIFVNCDVYSLGATLVACSVCGGGYEDVGQVSSAPLREFLQRLLAEHPDQRLSAAEALEHPYLAAQ